MNSEPLKQEKVKIKYNKLNKRYRTKMLLLWLTLKYSSELLPH